MSPQPEAPPRIGNAHRAAALACLATAVLAPLVTVLVVLVVAFVAGDAETLDALVRTAVPVTAGVAGALVLAAALLGLRGHRRALRCRASLAAAGPLLAFHYDDAEIGVARRVWRHDRRPWGWLALLLLGAPPAGAALGLLPFGVPEALAAGAAPASAVLLLRGTRTFLLDHAHERGSRRVLVWPEGAWVRGVAHPFDPDRPIDADLGTWGREPLLVLRLTFGDGMRRRRVHVPVPRDRMDDARRAAERLGLRVPLPADP